MKDLTRSARQIPAINSLVGQIHDLMAPQKLPHKLAVRLARQIASRLRHDKDFQLSQKSILAHLDPLLSPGPKRVLNGTGILLHTNLGRAPLNAAVVEEAFTQVAGYTDLEMDLSSGKRGHRDRRFAELAHLLWSVEDATLVNNAAAAVTLSIAALASNRQTVISRGELIEIGGSFRMPDIMRLAGTQLVEVGTTNKTRIEDYRMALGPNTGCLFKTHPSNYRIEGFTAETRLKAISQLGREHEIPVIMDLGSGLSRMTTVSSFSETTIEDCLEAEPDLVIFSGDKLLGGVQAGIILGTRQAIQRLRKHAMMRMVRVDKFTQALICHQLTHIAFEKQNLIFELANMAADQLKVRGQQLMEQLPSDRYTLIPTSAYLGGGSMPGEVRPSYSLVHHSKHPQKIAKMARGLRPALIGYIHKDAFHINLAAILPKQDQQLLTLLHKLTH